VRGAPGDVRARWDWSIVSVAVASPRLAWLKLLGNPEGRLVHRQRGVMAISGVILALPDRPEIAHRVLAAATRLAELTRSGRINVLAIRTPPASTILASEEVLTAARERGIREEESKRVDALKEIFENWSRTALTPNVTVEWADREGLADRLVDEWGRRADFIVLKRPLDHQLDQERRAIHAGLFYTGRPVLVVPPQMPPAPFGRRIAVAWRDDGRTIKAVLSGLRCAAQVEAVDVLAGTRVASQPARLPDIFEEHAIKVELHVLPITGQQVFGETLLHTAHQLGADMLVMGAFVHPVRSLILGGVTRYMLSHADLPVLMRR
jgi:nucleotide-binding universal stress UspA family protein